MLLGARPVLMETQVCLNKTGRRWKTIERLFIRNLLGCPLEELPNIGAYAHQDVHAWGAL